MHAGVYLPITNIGVAPFRSHRDRIRCELAPAKPRSQKALREAVRTRRVEIANARVVSGVEDLERGGAEKAKRYPGGSGYGCFRIRAFSSSNSASVSTPDCLSSLILRNWS